MVDHNLISNNMSATNKELWFQDGIELPYFLCWRGKEHNLPVEACAPDGVPFISPIYAIPPVSDPKVWKPLHAFKNLSRKEFVCLICRAKKAGNGKESDWNACLHIRCYHIEEYPINMWLKEDFNKLETKWKSNLDSAKRAAAPTTGGRQITLQQLVSLTRPVKDQLKSWTEGVILGALPLTIERNKGTRHIIKSYNNGIVPRGLSYFGITKTINEEKNRVILEYQEELGVNQLQDIPLLDDDDDPYKLRRIFGFGHDIWSNRNGDSFTAATLTYIDKSAIFWELRRVRILFPHDMDHSAENNLIQCQSIAASVGISFNNFLAVVQDTTGNSINTFNPVDNVSQLLCCAHTNELICSHSVSGCPELNFGIDAIKKLLVRAKGSKSSKRRRILKSKCEEAFIPCITVYLPNTTRWGTNVPMVNCFQKLKPALDLFTDADIPSTREEQTQFTDLVAASEQNLELVQACVPLLTVIFQWTQTLTSANTPTSGLVLLQINRIKATLEHLLSLSVVPGVNVPLRNQIRAAHSSFKYQIDKYYNEDFTEFWIYTVAAFLDPRGFCAIEPAQWPDVFGFIKKMCKEDEIFSAYELNLRTRDGERRNVRARGNAPVLSAEDQAIALILGTSQQFSAVVPVTEETTKYIEAVRKEDCIKDPLKFWFKYQKEFPILSRVASQVLAQDATSGDQERINSRGGIYYTPHRNLLKPDIVKHMIMLNNYYNEKEPHSARAKLSETKTLEFIDNQSNCCRADRYNLTPDGVEYLNGLCDWIVEEESDYEDDSEEEDEEIAI